MTHTYVCAYMSKEEKMGGGFGGKEGKEKMM